MFIFVLFFMLFLSFEISAYLLRFVRLQTCFVDDETWPDFPSARG